MSTSADDPVRAAARAQGTVGATVEPAVIEPAVVDPAAVGPGAEAGPAAAERLTRGELQDRAVKGALWTLLNVIVSLPVAFVVNIVLARVLGVVDYGRLAFLSAVVLLVGSIADMGLGAGVVQFGAKAHADGRVGDVTRLLAAAQGIRLLVFTPITTVAVLLILDADPVLLAVAVVFGVVLPAVLGTASSCLTIENRTARNAQAAMVISLVTQVGVVAVAVTVRTADSVWAVRAVAAGLGIFLLLAYTAAPYRRALFRPRLRGFPPGFWAFAVPAGLSGVVEIALTQRSEVLVLTWMGAAEAAGVFALAFGLTAHIFAPAQALVGPLVPAISGLREVDVGSVGRALDRTLRASATVMAPIIAAGIPALACLVPVIYGEEFAAVPAVLVALGAAGGLLVIASPVKAFALARLSGGRLLAMNLTALVVDVGLMLLLIPPLGVWGAVLGNACAAVVLFGLLLGGELRSLGLAWGSGLRSVQPYLWGTVVCAAVWSGVSALRWEPVPSALTAAACGLVLVVVALRVTGSGLTAADADAVLRAMPARLRAVAAPVVSLVAAARGLGRHRRAWSPWSPAVVRVATGARGPARHRRDASGETGGTPG